MGQPVSFEQVVAAVERFGPLAVLVTVSDTGRPHLGTVHVARGDAVLGVRVGPSTAANARAQPRVTLSWLPDGADYQLIVDGEASVGGGPGDDGLHELTIRPDRGILHRVAGHEAAGPSCVALAG